MPSEKDVDQAIHNLRPVTRTDVIVWCAIGLAACVLSAFIAAMTFGQIGYERGDEHGWRHHAQTDEANKEIMKRIGTCQWAQVVANCTFKDAQPWRDQYRGPRN